MNKLMDPPFSLLASFLVLPALLAGCDRISPQGPEVQPGATPWGAGVITRYVQDRPVGLVKTVEEVLWEENGVLVNDALRVLPLIHEVDRRAAPTLEVTHFHTPADGADGYNVRTYGGLGVVVSLDPDLAVCSVRPYDYEDPGDAGDPFDPWIRRVGREKVIRVDTRRVARTHATSMILGRSKVTPVSGIYAGKQAPLGDRVAVVSNAGLVTEVTPEQITAGAFDVEVEGVVFTFKVKEGDTLEVSRSPAEGALPGSEGAVSGEASGL